MYVTSGPAHAIRVLSQSCCDFCRPKCISLPSDRSLLLPWCYCLLICFCVFQIGCQYLWTICPFFLDFSTWQFVLYGHSTFTAFSGRTFCLCRSVLSFLVIRLFISFKGLCWSVECLLLHWSVRFFSSILLSVSSLQTGVEFQLLTMHVTKCPRFINRSSFLLELVSCASVHATASLPDRPRDRPWTLMLVSGMMPNLEPFSLLINVPRTTASFW